MKTITDDFIEDLEFKYIMPHCIAYTHKVFKSFSWLQYLSGLYWHLRFESEARKHILETLYFQTKTVFNFSKYEQNTWIFILETATVK